MAGRRDTSLGRPSNIKIADPPLAANKHMVYDMWRTLMDANDIEAAKKYIDENYIKHDPNIDTGLDVVLAYFSSLGDAKEGSPH